MNDKQYNNFIKRQLEENEESYFSDVEQNKNRTWNLIEHRLEKRKIIPLWSYYAAASIILFFAISLLFGYKMDLKNAEIIGLNKKITDLESKKGEGIVKVLLKTDTLQLIKDRIIYIPNIMHDTVVKYITITNQITKTDTVYLKEKLPELIAENENSNSANFIPLGNIITYKESKKRRKKRFTFRFGQFNKNSNKHKNIGPLISFKTGKK